MKEEEEVLNELKKLNSKMDRLIQILSAQKSFPERSGPEDIKKSIEEKIRNARKEADMKLAELRKEMS